MQNFNLEKSHLQQHNKIPTCVLISWKSERKISLENGYLQLASYNTVAVSPHFFYSQNIFSLGKKKSLFLVKKIHSP